MADDPNSASENESASLILASLCAKAPDNEIRDCLRRYNPDHSLKQQKTALKQFLAKTLAKTAKYLNIKSEMNKDPLIHNIICKIQNLLPDSCKICNEVYCSKLEDDPFLACHVCGQEVHKPCFMKLLGITDPTVTPVINPHNLPGLHYLCPECEIAIIPPPDKPNASDTEEIENITPSQMETSNDRDETNRNQDQNNELTVSTENPETKNPLISLPNPESDNELEPNKKICIHYKKNQCKHGMKGKGCPFYHPERCKKLMHSGTAQPNGCNLGRKCPAFHPKMCPSSITKRECFDEKCNFTHVKGTKRRKSPAELNPKSTKLPPEKNSFNSSQPSSAPPPNTADPEKARPSPDVNADLHQQSFLEMIRLLKVELTEAIETKIATAISQLPQYRPPQNLYPQNLYPHLQQSQFQMNPYQMRMSPPTFPPTFPPQQLPQAN